ncbi:MAG: CARDB domain-containing protein [Candidatus Acidiferrales bacterium]
MECGSEAAALFSASLDGSHSGSTALTIPAATASGSYYILAKADADDIVVENQEFNNVAYDFVQVGPDLTISTFAAPSSAGAGLSLTVSDTTKNQGGGAVGNSITRFYLSTNGALSSDDVALGERSVPPLAAGASHFASTSVAIPGSTANGNYYLLAKTDADDAVPESQETNNLRYSYVQIGPDLVAQALTAPSSAGAGSTVSIADTIKNQGGGASGASVTRFYLSANTLLDSGDLLLGERALAALPPASNSAGSTAVTLPSSLAGGTYHYIFAVADAAGTVGETAEHNNTRFMAILITTN